MTFDWSPEEQKVGRMERIGESTPGRRVSMDKGLERPRSAAHLGNKWSRLAAGQWEGGWGRLLAIGPDLIHEANFIFFLSKAIVSL